VRGLSWYNSLVDKQHLGKPAYCEPENLAIVDAQYVSLLASNQRGNGALGGCLFYCNLQWLRPKVREKRPIEAKRKRANKSKA
jgi:hypothetical protein